MVLLGSSAINGTGNMFANTIIGNRAANKINSSGGNDIVKSGSGNDVITGGAGRDTMTGGAGADDYDFNYVGEIGKGSTRDVITDFAVRSDDIDLSTIDANGSAAGHTFIFLAGNGTAFTGVRGQLHWFQENRTGTVNDRTIVEGDTNGDRVADFQIQLNGLKSLTASDFIL